MKYISPWQSSGKRVRLTMALVLLLQALLPLTQVQTAQAAIAPAIASASFSAAAGNTGHVYKPGTILYASSGATLQLAVTTTNAKCVQIVIGAYTANQKNNGDTWTFSGIPAAAGSGTQSALITAYSNSGCNQDAVTGAASYISDNTGPTVNAALNLTANGAGWHNSDVMISWTASDNTEGSGVASGPTPPTDSVTANTSGVTKMASATDFLGNVGSGSVTVKLDKSAPAITGSRSPAVNAFGWNNQDVTISFSCDDIPASPIGSGIKSCSGPQIVSTEGANQSRNGTATDNADNSNSVTVSGISIDKTAPALSGAPTTSANAAGWYNGDVAIHWTASDALSGLSGSAPADSTIASEGTGLTAGASVMDLAGNSVIATSAPPVNIDKTPPNTNATAPSNWNNSDVTVSLAANDALSGVAATYYRLDGGAWQSGNTLSISTEGIHALDYYSVDKAGNTEQAKLVQVKIDKTPPTISHSQEPAANGHGWNNTSVTVIFICSDGPAAAASGIASCTPPQAVTTEGTNQPVPGTAVDNANNSATDPATVSIDKTAPSISGAPDRSANANGWYNADVTVRFTCGDDRSGVDMCAQAQTLAEGANQSASGNATDAAGNSSSATVSGINVDKTNPTLTGAPTTLPNDQGWYRSDVTIVWTAADALSSIEPATQPANSVLSGEGNTLTAAASVADKAGNVASATVANIKIDRTPPGTTVALPTPFPSGWYAGSVEVTLNATDNLSGIQKTYYSVDGDTEGKPYSSPFIVSGGGTHNVRFYSVDNAGNSEDPNAPGRVVTFQIDNLPPTITGGQTPDANASGWNNGDVTVNFTCKDAETAIADCGPSVLLSSEGKDQSAPGQAHDVAGNFASTTVGPINIDKTPPTTTDDAPSGWKNGDVTVRLAAVDQLSGVWGTYYSLDDATAQIGSNVNVTVNTEGDHVLQYRSQDNADNLEDIREVPIRIDKTLPTISGAPDRAANAYGWYNASVMVKFTCADGLSGVALCTDAKTLDEGSNQSVPGTVTDNAGNSAATTVGPINIDKTAPTLTGGPTTLPNSDNWYNDNVTVAWSATDTASGIDATTMPGDILLTAEAAGQRVDANVKDLAGNEAAATSAPPINIDKTNPTISGATDRAPNAKSWYNANVTVTFTCADNLSGVGWCTPAAVLGEGANQSVSGTVRDKAGNTAGTTVGPISIDKAAPTITHSREPVANVYGWNNTNVQVTFVCADDLAGVDTCTDPQTVTGPGKDMVVSGTATDAAGNNAADTATVSIDKTKPTISAAPDHTPNANTWYKDNVTVSFTCNDDLSGVATCTDPIVLGEGANQSAAGTVVDKADNTAAAAVTGINVDKTKPTITGTPDRDANANGWYNANVIVHWVCSDLLSGIAACPADSTVDDEGAALSAYAYVLDLAGNIASATVSPIKIDKIAPTIAHSQSPSSNVNGWNNTDVTVTFACDDNLSGVASCTAPKAVASEGKDMAVSGTAIDNADNSASGTVKVSIDKSKPTLAGKPTTAPNVNGWYNKDVTIAWSAGDTGSGIDPNTLPADSLLTAEGQDKTADATVKDLAGNETKATSAPAVSIDQTAPTIKGAKTTDPNTNGWYNTDVIVHWVCSDNLSGVDTCPADSTVSSEGATLSASASAFDLAGNRGIATVSSIAIDKTKPTIIHSQEPAANAYGWNNTGVTVNFTCTDELSGVATCTDPQTVTDPGADRPVPGTATDIAGNSASNIAKVSIDKTAPTISGAPDRDPNGNHWYSDDVKVTFTCADDLSGVASCTAPITLGEGEGKSASGTAADKADNAAGATVSGINIDKTKPTITGAPDRAANAAGWYKTDVTVTFVCGDSLSGVAWCSPAAVLGQGENQAAPGTVLDKAGNTASTAVGPINVDKTAPTIMGSKSPAPNAAGWNKTDVTVTFTCADALSGVEACTSPQTIGEGDNQSASGTAADKAGNSAGATISPIKVDKTAPTITWNGGPADGGVYYFGSVPVAPTCTANDALSGSNGCTVSGYSTAISPANNGTTMTANGNDIAGNQATEQRNYTVKGWTTSGFFQPVDMTSSVANLVWNTVKNGSTVPLKFRIFAGAIELKDVATIKSVTSAQVVCTAGTEDAVEEVAATTGGTVLRYDTTAGQFVYNWATPKKAGNCYRVTMTGQDSSTIIAYFKLK